MSTTLKDLKLWQEAVAIAGDTVRLAQGAARRETRAYSDALVRAAAAFALAVADGCGRYEAVEQRRALAHARRALLALETLVAVGRQAGLLKPGALTALAARQAVVARLLAGTTTWVERQIALAEPAAGRAGDARPAPPAAAPSA